MLALALVSVPAAFGVQAKGRNASSTRTAPARTQTAAARFLPLPASDMVLAVDMRRLLNEGVPRALAGQTERAAQVNNDIEQFRARTGIDPRQFDTLTVGARLDKTPTGAVKFDHIVVLASGKFDMESVVAAARKAPGGQIAEQQHGGKSLYVLGINDQIRLFGLLRMRVGEMAFAAPEAGMLAVGEPAAVRAAIDAAAGRGRVDAALVNGARIGGDALAAFAGNVPAGTFAGIDVGLPNVNRSIESIRGFTGSVGMNTAGYQMRMALRTQNAADARQLGDTVLALKSIAPGFISVAGERAKFAGRIVESLKITTQGSEVQLGFDMSQEDLGQLLRMI